MDTHNLTNPTTFPSLISAYKTIFLYISSLIKNTREFILLNRDDSLNA